MEYKKRERESAKTPLNADQVFVEMPETTSTSSSCSSSSSSTTTMEESPVRIFVLFHKAMRFEMDRLYDDALVFVGDGRIDEFELFAKRWRFVLAVYRHHCNAEDEVILPTLDLRVKNVAQAYSLEHHGERILLSQLFELLNSGEQNDDNFRRVVANCVGAIRTSLSQHLSKEEKQVFPLLVEKFTFEEQADLVWHFFCSIPVNVIAEFLPWLPSCISPHDRDDMMKCLCNIVPKDNLLKQVIYSWMEGISTENCGQFCEDDSSCGSEQYVEQTERQVWTCQHSRNGKRISTDSECLAVGLTEMHPINEILHWHNAIKNELREILEVAKKIQLPEESYELATFHVRLQFIADICNFHCIAEDQIIFPAVEEKFSFIKEQTEEESHFNNFRQLIEKIQNIGVNTISPESYSELLLQVDHIFDSIYGHFQNEDDEVLPLVRLHICPEKQRELIYKSICVMPLKLLESVIPWFVSTLTEKEFWSFLQNIQMAASTSDAGLVALLSDWAFKGHSQNISGAGSLICMSLKAIDGCPLKENGVQKKRSKAFCESSPYPTDSESLLEPENDKRPSKKSNSLGSSHLISFLPPLNSPYSKSYNSCAPSLDTILPYEEVNIISSFVENTVRPIDTIFKFHKAICKDLEYLDIESGKILSFDEASLEHFEGRFRLLWGLYKAHSTVEDDIVFPALESREALHNVSHSYTLDHNQEEKLFQEISAVLEDLSQLQACFAKTNAKADSNCKRKHNELATKLQSKCKSIRVSLEQHVYREELELWPLFVKHFSLEEQNRIVGRIIGTTGAELIQCMLPWVTSALTLDEQSHMMNTWKLATKNTMFNEWLDGWWKQTPTPSDAESEMLSRWISYQQKSSQLSNEGHINSEDILGVSPSYRGPKKQKFGCEHYKRNCKLLAACCNKLFTCRFCHDKVSDHSMDRKATTQMLCMRCLTVQPVGQTCKTLSCEGFSMAKYFCPICIVFDDARNIYHCPFCNLCRVGKGLGIDFFHCMGCNFCLGMKLVKHKCRGASSETNCPICCEFLFTSTEPLRALRCGHIMHSTCFQAYTCSHYTCPICSKSLGDMTVYFGMLDAMLAVEELPEEYKDKCQDILCNDCRKKGRSRFHWMYHKCSSCGSYNTRVIKSKAK